MLGQKTYQFVIQLDRNFNQFSWDSTSKWVPGITKVYHKLQLADYLGFSSVQLK